MRNSKPLKKTEPEQPNADFRDTANAAPGVSYLLQEAPYPLERRYNVP
ncbi:hypothetical protein Hamer_G030669, partial [Homarus americanus]